MAPNQAVEIACLSDPGQAREHNEDSLACVPELGIVVLADGMGGHNAGEVASGMATSLISAGLARGWTAQALEGLDRDAAQALSRAQLQQQLDAANLAIYQKAESEPDCEQMGSTVLACLFHHDFVSVAHVGDSRLYRFRNEALEQVTRDHSLLQEQIDAGLLRKEDAHLSANKNLLTRAFGVDPDEPGEIHSHDTAPGDIYLLCSDGLYGMVGDADIEMGISIMRDNLGLAARQLVQAANDAGGHDNISVVLVRIAGGQVSAQNEFF
ncbi:PP2C family protein-serine/threonine phosphatase [Massilia glaciei]|uniref:PP2C family protein-serine/threonine phosphatase n=1 Tax=Massilia glaciei TaxID=1524097 RepID=UPI001E2DF2E8|nr:protein phosphatase 2C domain-containing protein [Massilia glaciei]